MNNQPMQTVSGIQNALLLFADVVDSSIYSSVWGMKEYAKQLAKFQELFTQLGCSYFTAKDYDPVIAHYDIKARGDEGIVFCVDPDIEPADLIYKAIKFSFELKARKELSNDSEIIDDDIPKRMKIAIGIHFGPVALISKNIIDEKTGRRRSIIDHVEGFSINYAKRIESSSRIGKYSKVFVSKEVALIMEGDPIVFAKHNTSLKGIEHSEDVFEVRSAFFENLPLDNEILDTEEFINAYSNLTPQTGLIREPWLKGLIISVLSSRADAAKDNVLKNRYLERISNFAWQKPVEDDPIILFCRARECLLQKKLTKSLTYFKKIVEMYPYFIHARKKMVETCWKIANTTRESSELVFARDTAHEFLTRYPDYLTDAEKKKFKEILHKTSQTKRKKR